MIHITELEKEIIIKIARSEYTCLNGEEPTYPNETSTWVGCVVSGNEDNAVLSSLIQKGIVCQYEDGKDSVCCLSDEGFKIYKSMEIIMPKKLITINYSQN